MDFRSKTLVRTTMNWKVPNNFQLNATENPWKKNFSVYINKLMGTKETFSWQLLQRWVSSRKEMQDTTLPWHRNTLHQCSTEAGPGCTAADASLEPAERGASSRNRQMFGTPRLGKSFLRSQKHPQAPGSQQPHVQNLQGILFCFKCSLSSSCPFLWGISFLSWVKHSTCPAAGTQPCCQLLLLSWAGYHFQKGLEENERPWIFL